MGPVQKNQTSSQRYLDQGIEGLHDELRPGRPRTYEDDRVAEVINRALQTKPTDGSTHWSARSLAAATGISKSTVHRWLQTFSLQPHRQKHCSSGRRATALEPTEAAGVTGRRLPAHRVRHPRPPGGAGDDG